MTKVVFDNMCRDVFHCENYIEWEHQEEIFSGSNRYLSDIVCVSCTEVGQSYNIEEYPDDCPYQVELEKYREQQEEEIKKFDTMMEQKRMWNRLNA